MNHVLPKSPTPAEATERVDVAVLGGGIAGLCGIGSCHDSS